MPNLDTSMGGGQAGFPTTLWGSILEARNSGRGADAQPHLDQLIRVYWKPVYTCVRTFWGASNEQAKDLTQDFFMGFLGRDAIAVVDPSKGSFRSFLRACLRNFMLDQHKRAGAAKRAAGTHAFSLDGDAVDLERLQADARRGTPEDTFDRAWLICLVQDSLQEVERELRAADHAKEWEVFRTFDLEPTEAITTYDQLATHFKSTAREVKTSLQYVRRRLRQVIREKIRAYCRTNEEAEREFLDLFPEDVSDEGKGR